jgi:16S rRNA (uracil1498-N3)-methyltransferase
MISTKIDCNLQQKTERIMPMPRFFLETINEEDIRITGEDARHIGRSLRMRVGEPLTVCANSTYYDCIITKITSDTVFLEAQSVHLCAAEPSISVTLYQAIPKADKLEEIIQKSIELGVSRIVPVLTARCVSRPKKNDFEKKLSRLQKIAAAAAKQSGRGIIPEVATLYSFSEALEESAQADCGVFLYEGGGVRFSEVDLHSGQHIALWIGSEGGFDPKEVEAAKAAGMIPVWLGNRILRCETAPQAALSILMHKTDNM